MRLRIVGRIHLGDGLGKGAVRGMDEDWCSRFRTGFRTSWSCIIVWDIVCNSNCASSYCHCEGFLPPPRIPDDVVPITVGKMAEEGAIENFSLYSEGNILDRDCDCQTRSVKLTAGAYCHAWKISIRTAEKCIERPFLPCVHVYAVQDDQNYI